MESFENPGPEPELPEPQDRWLMFPLADNRAGRSLWKQRIVGGFCGRCGKKPLSGEGPFGKMLCAECIAANDREPYVTKKPELQAAEAARKAAREAAREIRELEMDPARRRRTPRSPDANQTARAHRLMRSSGDCAYTPTPGRLQHIAHYSPTEEGVSEGNARRRLTTRHLEFSSVQFVARRSIQLS